MKMSFCSASSELMCTFGLKRKITSGKLKIILHNSLIINELKNLTTRLLFAHTYRRAAPGSMTQKNLLRFIWQDFLGSSKLTKNQQIYRFRGNLTDIPYLGTLFSVIKFSFEHFQIRKLTASKPSIHLQVLFSVMQG